MKQPILLTTLIFSALAANAQNLINTQVQVVNYTNNQTNTQQSANIQTNQSFTININDDNNSEQAQTNRGGSSAMRSFGNNGNKVQTNVKVQQNNTNKPQVRRNVGNSTNNDVVVVNRGNNFEINENVSDNNVGNQSNPYRGGNINEVNINSNPVVKDTKKTVATKPVIQDAPGLDFKPSGLSGRDYSNGGKLKKGQKNFYSGSTSKHKTVHKKKPNFKKVKHHTSKCAKW